MLSQKRAGSSRKPFFLLFAFSLLGASGAWASEARVDAAGGLSLVMDDEVDAVNPFVLGDPAGLALIPVQNRLDLEGQYFYENETQDQFQRRYAGTVGDLSGDTVNYKGLILFPTDRWGVQLNGDYLYTEGQAQSTLDSLGNNRVRGLLRTAYNFGPLVLGAEMIPSQTSSPLAAQPLGNAQVVSGNENTTAWAVNGGLLACFPSDPGPRQDRFEIGGTYGNQLVSPQDTVGLNVIPGGSASASPLTLTFTDTTAQTIGPEAYFESPGSLQAAVVTRFVQTSTHFQETSPNTALVPSPLSYNAGNTSATLLAGAFKGSSPLGLGLELKTGGLLSLTSSSQNVYDSGGSATSTATQQAVEAQAGIGVEKNGDFTVGLQAALESVNGAETAPSGTDLGDTGYLAYSFSVGGERWISKQWAFRMGLGYVNQYNSGNVPFTTFEFPAMSPGVRLLTSVITVGAGFKDEGLYGDWEFSYGQPTRYGGDPSAFATQLGTQLALGISFH